MSWPPMSRMASTPGRKRAAARVVGDRLHLALVQAEGRLDQRLAVAGGAGPRDPRAGRQGPAQLRHHAQGQLQGAAAVARRTRTTRWRPCESTSTAFVVVDPASMPRKQGPRRAARVDLRRTRACACRSRKRHALRRRGTAAAAAPPRASARGRARAPCPRSSPQRARRALAAPRQAPRPWPRRAAPCSGTRTASGARPRVRRTAAASPGRKWRGPPRNATVPRMGLPQASPEMVWFTTAWRMLAAMSSRRAPSLMRGCTSVLAKTPQRAAMG